MKHYEIKQAESLEEITHSKPGMWFENENLLTSEGTWNKSECFVQRCFKVH